MKLKDLKQFKCYRIVGTDIEFVYLDRRGNPDIGCPRCMVIKHPDPNNYNYGDALGAEDVECLGEIGCASRQGESRDGRSETVARPERPVVHRRSHLPGLVADHLHDVDLA